MIILRFIFILLLSIFYDIAFYILGRLLFKTRFKRLGHYFVAASIAGDFGTAKRTRKWLFENCPYNHNCKDCRVWTCDPLYKDN